VAAASADGVVGSYQKRLRFAGVFFVLKSKIMMAITKDVPITVDREIMSGTPVFTGTRVPVSALLENLEAGVSLDDFLDNFPTVTRHQAVRVLEHFRSELNDISLAA
jgi:uncharacterized protein (DUF433 family)